MDISLKGCRTEFTLSSAFSALIVHGILPECILVLLSLADCWSALHLYMLSKGTYNLSTSVCKGVQCIVFDKQGFTRLIML